MAKKDTDGYFWFIGRADDYQNLGTDVIAFAQKEMSPVNWNYQKEIFIRTSIEIF